MKPWLAAALTGAAAALVGAWALPETPAYGICVACHGRELVSWLLFWPMGREAPAAATPLLTGVGLLLGARLGAAGAGEVRHRESRRPLLHFGLGVAVMIAALAALGCTTRLLLRSAYGDLTAIWSLAGVAGGIALATFLLLWQARRI